MDNNAEGGVLRRWNGEKWTDQGIPGSSSVWHVSGSGPRDVWMVGTNQQGQGLVLHGDGSKFDAVGYKGASVHGVWGGAPGDTWVAPYEGAIQHWDGKAWSTAPTTAGPLARIAGSGPDDVWAVGFGGVVVHYHAGIWSTPPTGTKQVLWSVWSRAPDDTWVVGNAGTLLRWNGSTWVR
jgi:hypothetical protein